MVSLRLGKVPTGGSGQPAAVRISTKFAPLSCDPDVTNDLAYVSALRPS